MSNFKKRVAAAVAVTGLSLGLVGVNAAPASALDATMRIHTRSNSIRTMIYLDGKGHRFVTPKGRDAWVHYSPRKVWVPTNCEVHVGSQKWGNLKHAGYWANMSYRVYTDAWAFCGF